RRRARGRVAVRGGARARRLRPGDPPADGARGHVAAAAGGHGDARARGAARRRRRARPGGAGGHAARGGRVAGAVRGLFVTGTDTGAGKSVVAAAICASLRAAGLRVAAAKPVLTGLDEPAEEWPRDDELLASVTGQAPEEVAPVRFGPP